MGKITQEQSLTRDKVSSKKLISDALRQMLREDVTIAGPNGCPTTITKAQSLSKRLIDIALFCDSPKTAVTAAKVIMEFTEGKPAVQDTKEKEALPTVEFVIQNVEDAEVIKQKALAFDSMPKDDDRETIDLGNGTEVKA